VCCSDTVAGVDSSSEWPACDTVDTSSDLLLAQMLQFEMDAEHDLQLKREEDKWNGTSKGLISFFLLSNFCWSFGTWDAKRNKEHKIKRVIPQDTDKKVYSIC